MQITLLIVTMINFFLQRNVTSKSNTNVWRAAAWYTVAYVVLTFGAAALQALYKTPIYELLMITWRMGATGEAVADVVTMLISCAVSFPIFKIIFRREVVVVDSHRAIASELSGLQKRWPRSGWQYCIDKDERT